MSSSSNESQRKYDVFLSFRGKDTRRGLVSHLEWALNKNKIEVFIDDKLKKGNETSPALLRAIEESDISLIVFSKSYADLVWCLEELVKIIKCKKNATVPIFYDVDPSTVRHQIGSYGEAFVKHETALRHDLSKLQSWRTALTTTANLSGLVSSVFKNDAELVEEIVKQVLLKLKEIKAPYELRGLMGIQEQIEEFESFLCNRKHGVHIIGIWGMDGIGKTTMASCLFRKVYHEYEGCYFLENVREEWRKCGKSQMKKKLISELLGKDVSTTIPYGLLDNDHRRLRRKKVLIVLDDVDDSDQLEDLTGAYDWFGPGSTIIMTSRDKGVFNKYCSDQMYKVKELNPEQSVQLFVLHAFKGCLKMEENDDLSKRFIGYANGNPLALKVLGSSLHGKSEEHWRSQLAKLEKLPFPKIQNVLKISYDALDRTEKDIFLYVACVFKGFFEEVVMSLLDNLLYPKVGLDHLEDKALITKSSVGYISMHDLIQEMGRQIVREESQCPGKRRHLWDHKDTYHVLKKKLGTEVIESISLQCERVEEIHLDANTFKRMTNLKFLEFKCKNGLHISSKGLDSLPEELKYFYWEWYPLKFPPKLCLKNLVKFHMRESKLERLWDGIQDLGNLKDIDLSGSQQLKELPDMSKACKLKTVILSSCCSLRRVHPSILSLRSVEELFVNDCSSLKKFSLSTSSEQLKYLCLMRSNIEEFCMPITHDLSYSLAYLSISETNVVSLPASMKHLSNLTTLKLGSCLRLRCIPELPPSIKSLDAKDRRSLEVFTPNFSTSCPRQQNLNPHYPLNVDFLNCAKLGEDTVTAIAKNFIYFITMQAIYQQPEPYERTTWTTCLPGSKISDVLDFLKRSCLAPETTQGGPNSELMTFIFCIAVGKQSPFQELYCNYFLQASNGERIQYRSFFYIPYADGDHVILLLDKYFNRNIINGIKESTVSSSATDHKYPKVSFAFSFKSYDDELFYIKENEMYPTSNLEIGLYRIYASELHYPFDANVKSSQDIDHPQSEMKNKRTTLAMRKVPASPKLSKWLLSRPKKRRRKARN